MTAVLGSQLDQVAGIEMLAGEGPAATRVFRRGRIGWDAHEQRIQVADRQWVMRISYGRFIDRIGRPLAILLFGAALSLLAMPLHRLQQRRLAAFQPLPEERERQREENGRAAGGERVGEDG